MLAAASPGRSCHGRCRGHHRAHPRGRGARLGAARRRGRRGALGLGADGADVLLAARADDAIDALGIHGIHPTNQSKGLSEHGINGGDGGAEDEFHADSDDDIATKLILEAVIKNHGHAFDYPMSKSQKMIRSMQMTEGLWNKAQMEAVQYKWASLTLKLMM